MEAKAYYHTKNENLSNQIYSNVFNNYSQNNGQLLEHKSTLHTQAQAYNSFAQLASQLLAYKGMAVQHVHQGIERLSSHYSETGGKTNSSIHYRAINHDYGISVNEGNLGNGVGYLALSLYNQNQELQNYTFLVKYSDRKSREVKQDEEITKGIDELLAQVSEKNELNTEEVIQTLLKIFAQRKDSEENLALTEIQLKIFEKSVKEKLLVESHDKVKSVIFMLELEKNLKLKQLIIRKKPETSKVDQPQISEEPRKEIRYNYLPSYLGTIADYIKKLEKKRNDFTHLAPFKTVHKFPVNMMGGVLGFTYLGENFMGIRDDLYGPELHEVELHEAIHTPDEYETRVITKWMLDNETKYH